MSAELNGNCEIVISNDGKSKWLLASVFTEDAQKGRNFHFIPEFKFVRRYQWYHNGSLKSLLWVFLFIQLGLAIVEKPSLPGFSTPYYVTIPIECLCLAFYLFRLIQMWSFTEGKVFWQDPKHLVILVISVVTYIDIIAYVASAASGIWCLRWTRILRPLYMVNFPEGRQFRRAFRNIRRTLPDVLYVLILFFFSIAIFALMAFKLFGKRGLRYPNGDSYFANYGDSFFDLYVLVTTANNPDVMMPAYDMDGAYALFFAGFLIICLYIFMSIFLAVVYNNFRNHLKNEVKLAVFSKRQMLAKAFELLKEPGSDGIEKEKFFLWMKEFVCPHRPDDYISIIWTVLDENGDNVLSQKEFLQLADLLNVEVSEVKDRRPLFQRLVPSCFDSRPSRFLRKVVMHIYFRYVFDGLIIVNAIFIALDMNQADWFFLTMFSLEILLKIYTFGMHEFFKQFWNWFDFVVIGAALLLISYEAIIHEEQETQTTLDVLLVLRVLRVVKIIGSIERFKIIVSTIVNLGPAIITYGIVLFVLYYMYAILGMELFSGKVLFFGGHPLYQNALRHPAYPNISFCGNSALNGTMFWDQRYCGNNFNHILRAFVVLFELTVVNQWHVITSGYVHVTSKWARLYFISFHLLCVIIILNIFTAFVIEAFILEYTLANRRLENVLEAKINEMGLGLGSKPKSMSTKSDKSGLMDDMEQELEAIDADHVPRQCAEPNSEVEGESTLRDMFKDTSIRFHLTRSTASTEVFLRRMFENEIEEGDLGLDSQEQESRPRRLTLDAVA